MPKTVGGKPFTLEMALNCVGKGWAELIKLAYKSLPEDTTISQIKEKYGTLRFYTSHETEDVKMAELLSRTTCESCGQLGKLREDRRWLLTLCDKCAKD